MLKEESTQKEKSLSKVIKINEAKIQNHLDRMVRSTVEQTLNDLLDAKADQLCNARRYERTEARTDQRAGHYWRLKQYPQRAEKSPAPWGWDRKVYDQMKDTHVEMCEKFLTLP